MPSTQVLIQEALIAHLAPSRIKRLEVSDELDADGDPVLRIRVVVEKNAPELDPAKVFSATGVVRRVLAEGKDDRFPLLTFPTSDELPGVAA